MIDSNILEYKNLEPLNVSRETFPQFEAYCELLKKENSKINLISKSTEKEMRKIAKSWMPYRSVCAIILWHFYRNLKSRESTLW